MSRSMGSPSEWDTPEDATADPWLDLLLPPDTPFADQLEIEALVEAGFTWNEAVRLFAMRQRLVSMPGLAQRFIEAG